MIQGIGPIMTVGYWVRQARQVTEKPEVEAILARPETITAHVIYTTG